ncbi:MAG: hypothetical protein J3Q66DRAFT_13854 [Benniella sp.]|nr:MAG: hypothetical protein J3Q66DRAFT_13854 [Benniella sp.]
MMRKARKTYNFLCVFRGQRIIQEREESSDEETFDIQPRLLWPQDSPGSSPTSSPPEPTTALEALPPAQDHRQAEKAAGHQVHPLPSTVKDNSACIPETPQELQGILDDLEFPHEREWSVEKRSTYGPTLPGDCTPPQPSTPEPETESARILVRDTLSRGYFSDTATPVMPAAPSRGYYSESIITTLKDDDGDMPAGGLPDVRQFPLRNPFLDDDYTADSNQLLSQESNEYQEALNADEQARFQRFEDARADLGFVIRGHKFGFAPSYFEELGDDEEGEEGEVERDNNELLRTCEPRLLWPKKRFVSAHPSTSNSQEQQQEILPYTEDDEEDVEAQPEAKEHDPRFTPSPSSIPKDMFSTVALRVPSSPYFYPVFDSHAAGSIGESSTYGSECKEAIGHEEEPSQGKKQPQTLSIRRPPKRRREEEEECSLCTFDHACDAFDACWGVRGHVVGAFHWFSMERFEYEGRVDKFQVIDPPDDEASMLAY